jgi:hypothetical protein
MIENALMKTTATAIKLDVETRILVLEAKFSPELREEVISSSRY